MDEINLKELLKDKQEGLELYSPLYGCVHFLRIVSAGISVKTQAGGYKTIPTNGKLYRDGEIMLYPSNDNRDWTTFNPPRWRAEIGGMYYAVNMFGDVDPVTDKTNRMDDLLYNCGNYFSSEDEAKESAIYKAFHPNN
jgi:hypothetical protein